MQNETIKVPFILIDEDEWNWALEEAREAERAFLPETELFSVFMWEGWIYLKIKDSYLKIAGDDDRFKGVERELRDKCYAMLRLKKETARFSFHHYTLVVRYEKELISGQEKFEVYCEPHAD